MHCEHGRHDGATAGGDAATARVDGFLDEDVDYALRLNRAGVPTELHVYPGACHGYQMAQQCEITRQSARDVEDWLARQLRVTG